MKLTQEKLKELLGYSPETGVFTWNVFKRNVKSGDVAGTVHPHGYTYIGVNGKRYKASRLAWLYMEGYYPENYIDHIDRDRGNDKWANLRHVSQSCNLRNASMKSTNKSGVTGVNWDKNKNSWHAQITVNYKNLWIGRFKEKIDAVKARWEAEKKYNFPNCNTTSSAYEFLKREGVGCQL